MPEGFDLRSRHWQPERYSPTCKGTGPQCLRVGKVNNTLTQSRILLGWGLCPTTDQFKLGCFYSQEVSALELYF